MTKYLNRVMVNGLQDPGIGLRSAFLPEGAPLLEYLAVYQEMKIQVVITVFQKVSTFTGGNKTSQFHAHVKFARD